MLYYRCSCGRSEAFGSDSPARCDGCEECGSGLYSSRVLSLSALPPQPHELIKQYDRNTGEQIDFMCTICYGKFSKNESSKMVESGRALWSQRNNKC